MIREPRSEFVGRRRELVELGELLDRARLVTLTGVGGAGKTRLAMRAVANHAAHTDRTPLFVSLESVQDPLQVPLAVMRALPQTDQSAREPLDVIEDALGDAPVVLVLDNCEHLIDAAAAFADELLDALPQLTIVATSRRPLELEGEHVYPVPPLSVEAADDTHAADAVTLLVARARAADASFRLAGGDQAAAVALCRALDGLPLAIELAATRLRSLPLAELVERLSSRFTLLRGGPRGAVARQRTLRAVVDWSYELCTPEQRDLWQALATFAGPFDLGAAIAVAGGEEDGVVAALDELVRQSVVEADHESGRYRLLETIRRYGRERADESGAAPQLTRRHIAYFMRIVEDARVRWHGPDQGAVLARLRADRAELQIALTAAVAAEPDAALALFSDLRFHWAVGGFLPEGREWAARVLALEAQSPARRLAALITAAWLGLLQGDLAEARRRLDEAEALARREGLEGGLTEIELHRWRGTLAMFSGDPAGATAFFERSIAAADAADLAEEGLLAGFQLTTARSHCRLPDAAAPARAALGIAERIGDTWMRAHALWSLALSAYADGDAATARRRAREAITLEQGIDDAVGDCLMLEVLAWSESETDPEHAAVLLGAAQTRWRRIGSAISVHGPHLTAHHDRARARVRETLGERTFARLMESGAAKDAAAARASALSDDAEPSALSPRERDVARRIHDGLSNRDIAEELVLSVRTVDSHVQRILGKLGVSTRAQIAVWYEAQGAPVR